MPLSESLLSELPLSELSSQIQQPMQADATAKPLQSALLASMTDYQQALHGRRIWLACSGGRDSLSLAAICQQLYRAGQLPFLPQLLHVNHGMQAASDAWAQQVERWAQQQHIPCQILSVKVDGDSEQAARDARYKAIMAVMNQGDVLMLAHHSDDQAETVLMRLFNGAGVTGLAGMQAWTKKQRQIPVSSSLSSAAVSKDIYLWRPWLQVSRQQITDYAKSQQLNYIDDPTNVMVLNQAQQAQAQMQQSEANQGNEQYQGNDRAWLRSVLLPQIHSRYPKASDAIARSSQLLQDASQIIAEQVQDDLAMLSVANSDSSNLSDLSVLSDLSTRQLQSILSIDKLQTLSTARQSAVIHAWLSPHALDLSASKQLVDQVLALSQRTDGDHQTCLYWHSGSHGYQIRRYQQQLYRLRSEWLQWLEILPSVQYKSLNSMQNCASDKNYHTQQSYWILKSAACGGGVIEWQLHGADALLEALQNGQHKQQQLVIEALPKQLPVTLAGRRGRKQGKKLYQELQQPTFARPSVMLCSLQNAEEYYQPLFIVSALGQKTIHVLQNEYSAVLLNLVNSQQLYTKFVCQDDRASDD
ncbi:tRNA lysidine(34) synthetase TilS [Psychrobacter sp. I-STPA10]|uniref:tRNA lysidine(34) synthetase TilS n=1 Tax=Psychrobacter sp. I-STPA10 TaxID=2585769 RepID=UPI001E447E2B|nr:tRNA lysidine(34) synthetase TilS [Psychrobacter sp. I-STPA10]